MSICIICVIIFSGCISNYIYKYGEYEIDFSRNYSNSNERNAIEIAESINYSTHVNMSRFDSDWANFIDSGVIAHYNNSFFQAKENKEEINIYYEYFANVRFYPELNINIESENWYLDI